MIAFAAPAELAIVLVWVIIRVDGRTPAHAGPADEDPGIRQADRMDGAQHRPSQPCGERDSSTADRIAVVNRRCSPVVQLRW